MLDVYFLTLNNSLSKQYCLTMVYSQISFSSVRITFYLKIPYSLINNA